MRRGAMAAVVLLGMWAMVDNAISGQDLSRFSRTVNVNGLTFPVLDYGEGSPVLLLHGFPDDRYLWRNQAIELPTAGLRVIAPDLRGFGDAPRPPIRPSTASTSRRRTSSAFSTRFASARCSSSRTTGAPRSDGGSPRSIPTACRATWRCRSARRAPADRRAKREISLHAVLPQAGRRGGNPARRLEVVPGPGCGTRPTRRATSNGCRVPAR